MAQQVKRVGLDGSITQVIFPNQCGRYLVKNFSDEDVYVSFEESVELDTSIKITVGMAQVCIINERNGAGQEKSNSIYLKGTGEIEVQQLWW